ncbi:MAG: UDP-N-acetylmuramoyl-L-alanine--D-glutamate ligase [Sphingomonadaceae bacterium]|nr:UDP-N-acetylmuramoyl-L-alanine--D-glutamate ligase [Sphingomonadaceae bacterium]
MITSPAFAGKRYAILGLARSGMAAAESLLASGAHVLAWDRQDVARAPLEGRCELVDPLEADLTGYDGIVVSPGVPLNTHPIVAHAAKYGVPVIGDIELFAQARAALPPHKVVGITGTNGKSTTTALVTHILETAGIPTLMGGNIGLPILGQDPLPAGGVYVLELSSYQIDLTQSLDCDVAAILNVTPDHLDRYAGFREYMASKERLFEMQSAAHPTIFGEFVWHHQKQLYERWASQRTVWCLPNVSDLDPFDTGDPQASITSQDRWPSLQGPHNFENALVAILICDALDMNDQDVAKGLETFTGLPHRMERVAEHNGVLFINDSKATNVDSTAPALAAYLPDPAINGGAPRIHWIVGGLAKEDGLGPCEQHLANIAAVYTIGEAGPRFAELLEGSVPVERCELLCEAVNRAKANSRAGEVILFSPACASFDQFRDYEKRGEAFRELVDALTGAGSPAA